MSASEEPRDLHVIDIFMMSVKCGNCETYQTIVGFKKFPDKNVYTYECENERCDPAVTRTLIEVPRDLDAFAHRDPQWRGGGRHGEVGDGAVEE